MSMAVSSTKKRIVIRGGRLVDPAQKLDLVTDIYIADGIVLSIGQRPVGFSDDEIIHAEGALVIPGAVDLCAHLREPGSETRGTIYSETRAAAAAGITHIVCTPDTTPVVDSAAIANLIQERAWQTGYCHVYPIGALTRGLEGQQLSEMYALRESGCIGFSQMRMPVRNHRVLLRCLEYAATFDLTVFFQSVDTGLAGNGCAHAGPTATRLGLTGIPSAAETIALSRDLLLVEHTGVRAHFGQLSCARSVELIADAQARGLRVTADVAAHQLFLTDTMMDGFNSVYHVNPPLRTEADRLGLIEGVRSGIITAICSDHQPHEAAAKAAPFAASAPGISAFSTYLPLSYDLVRNGTLSVADWVRRISLHPAQIIGLEAGSVRIGDEANLTVFAPDERWILTDETLFSLGANSPWFGTEIEGRVRATLHDGRISFRL
ncbi:Dihydroorotase-like protein [gamma proteobacterium HdN1]|nr:Dihydroorotase-like protein [gamma proteobacterium HdN1]